MRVLLRVYCIIVISFSVIGAFGNNKCLSSLQIYSQISFGLTSGAEYIAIPLQIKGDFEIRVIKGSIQSQEGVGSRILNQYLYGDLIEHYRAELEAPPELLISVKSASAKHLKDLTLVVIGKKNSESEFVIYGGTGLYSSVEGVDGLPLMSEIQDLRAAVKLPHNFQKDLVVEIGRLAMLNRKDLDPKLKRELFIKMQGVAKQILRNERKNHESMVLLSFTTKAHERFYGTLGVQMERVAPVKVNLDNKQRFISAVSIDSLPE